MDHYYRKNLQGQTATVYSPEEYAGMRKFVSEDGKTFFALKGDEIVSAGSSATGDKSVHSMLQLATELGGRRVNSFDTLLPDAYAQGGFRATSRVAFDVEKAPVGWNQFGEFDRFNGGRPDVVHMVWDPAKPRAYQPGEGTMYTGPAADMRAENSQINSATALHRSYSRAAIKANNGAGSNLRFYDDDLHEWVKAKRRGLKKEIQKRESLLQRLAALGR